MRLYFKTTPNTEPVPFTYQVALVGALHKWLGDNDLHDDMSLYSLSWLYNGKQHKDGLEFPQGAGFFISAPDTSLHQRIVAGVFSDPGIRYGLNVQEVQLAEQPVFGNVERFMLQSPALIKRSINGKIKFYYPEDPEADTLLTETLQHKLRKIGKGHLQVKVGFDRSYPNIKIRLVNYKGINNKATFCPVIVEGDPEAIALAWEVGVGNSTGIGFGAVR